jgi:hypothetical protein
MAILATSTMEPSATLHQGSRHASVAEPVLRFALQSKQAVRSLTQYLFMRAYYAASFMVYYTLLLTQIFAFHSCATSKFLAVRTASTCRSLYRAIWDSRRIKRIRKRIEFEFFVTILGPSGNNVLLLVFWPGWLLIVPAIWALCTWAG